MSILAKHLAFVNEQGAFHTRMAEKFKPETWRGKMHVQTAEKFAALLADLEIADKQLDTPQVRQARPPSLPFQLSLNIEDIEGLPEELVQELNLTEGDKTEFAILNAIEEAGGVITLDRLLIALYRKTGDVHKRANLTSRIYRMTSKGLLYNIPGKKGVYSTDQWSSDSAAQLFGGVAKSDT